MLFQLKIFLTNQLAYSILISFRTECNALYVPQPFLSIDISFSISVRGGNIIECKD